jgi:hypothetical protein
MTFTDAPQHGQGFDAQPKPVAVAASAMREPLFPRSDDVTDFADRLPIRLGADGRRILARAFMRFTGAVLIFCAPGLWLLPGSIVDPALMLYKLGASIFFAFVGAALILRNRSVGQPEVYFDPIRREMRILQKTPSGRPETVLRRSYDTLGAVKLHARQLEIWDVDGSILVNIPLDDSTARQALRVQLAALIR